MVRCYQLEPEEGWRFFMLHKIDRIEGTNESFLPRAKITLTTGEILQSFEPDPTWTDNARIYRDMIGDALADEERTQWHRKEDGKIRTREHFP